MSDKPWARVREPMAIPESVTAKVLKEMDQDEFDLLLRSHLVPRETTASYRRAWNRLWGMLRADAELNDETYTVLERWSHEARHAKEDASLDEAERKRARKFVGVVSMGMDRINRVEALDWAGALAGEHPEQSRAVIATLVGAIAKHRTAVTRDGDGRAVDNTLWSVLRRLQLDPRDYGTIEREPPTG